MADKNNKGYGVPAAPAVPAPPAKPAAPAAPAGRPGKSTDNASPNVREVSAKERIDARRRELEKKLAAKATAGSSEARKSSPSATSRAYAETSPQVGSSPSRATPPAGAGRRPAAAPFLEEHPHPKGVSDRLRQTIAHTTSGRPKDAFGKGMKKPQATVRAEGGKPASPEEAPKKKSCLSSIFGIIIALILLSQVGGCVASCVGDVFDSIDDDTSSWFEDSGSERQDGSSSSMNSFSNDEADEAAALASARDALASLDSYEKIVDCIAQGINARYVKMFGFSADDAGVQRGHGGTFAVVAVAVDQREIRADGERINRELHRLHPCAENIRCIDLRRADGGHRPRLGLCYNYIVERIAFFRCQLLRVI